MDVPRIPVNQLKEMMDNGEPVTIIDARARSAYATSSKQIKGAFHLDPDDNAAIAALAVRLNRDRPVVVY